MTKWQAEITLKPAFHDLDPMAIVWHGHYVKYLELARCALLQQFDYDYEQMAESGYMWPIVDMRVKYVRSIEHHQTVLVRATMVEWEFRLKIDYLIIDSKSNEILTKAQTIQVAVDRASKEMQFSTPAVFRKRIGAPL